MILTSMIIIIILTKIIITITNNVILYLSPQSLKIGNVSGTLPVRALLCSYTCFNAGGHDYYGVAFP